MGDEDSTDLLVGDIPARFGPRTTSASLLSGIERFTMLKKLGEGGMGSVFAAYDSVLDRRVAVKLVRADRRTASAVLPPRLQLLREAQAMARLSHPNVVAVHEVGEIGDDVFLVLELIEGTTMKAWLKERPRSWREIVEAYAQAGRGLAAAHEAGLVHRDFKPSNVLVRRDGRILVADFGVVSMSGASPSSSTESPAVEPVRGHITFVGRRVGTPHYMAPEQYAGLGVDGRADQYSFCVSLWEGLYGAHPCAGEGAALAQAMRAGLITTPANPAVPRRIEVALRRGLSPDADARFASMDELLGALSDDRERTRRRRFVLGAGGAALAGLGVLTFLGWTREGAPPVLCEAQDAPLAGRWDGPRATALRSAFSTSGLPYAEAAATRIVAQLDGWSSRWVEMRTAACRATRVTGEQSEALLDARMRCLDRQLDEVDQLAASLVTTERDVIAHVSQALSLPDLATCASHDAVLVRVPAPSAPLDRVRLERLEHGLALVHAAERTGRYPAARVRAEALVREAQELGFAPLTAHALVAKGRIEEQDGDLAAALATLGAGARTAASASDDRAFAEALLALVEVHLAKSDASAALALGVAAEAAAARISDRRIEAAVAELLGAAHQAAGDSQAEPYLRRALALREADAGVMSVEVAQVLNRLGGLAADREDHELARSLYQRGLEIVEAQLGPAHPATAITRANLCYLDAQAGALVRARECQEGVLATLEVALGADHPQVAWALNEIALVQRAQGDLDGAVTRFGRALAIWERASGPEHPDLGWPLVNLGEIANERGESASAVELCGRAVAILERHTGRMHPDVVPALACAARAALAEAPVSAVAFARRAHEIATANAIDEDGGVGLVLVEALAATGDRAEAGRTARALLTEARGQERQALERWLRAHP